MHQINYNLIIVMKSQNTDSDGQKYRELIQRMENCRKQINISPKNNPNLVYMSSKARSGLTGSNEHRQTEPEARRPRQQTNDDLRLRSIPIRPDFGRMPNSAKNYRNEQVKGNMQELFKRNRDSKNPNSKYSLRAEDPNSNSPKEKKLTKQLPHVLSSTDKVESNTEYEKLHQKLDHIQNKISEMKSNLQRKKEEKRKTLEHQKQNLVQVQAKNENKASPLKGYLTQAPQHKELHAFNKNPYSPNHNIYYVSQVIRAYKEEKSIARQHLFTSLQVFRMLQNSRKPTDEEMLARRVDLPRRKGTENKKTVVFDLDETLIHCNQNLNVEYDVKLPIKFPTGEIIEAGINIRPYCRQILQALSKKFQIIVFTASHSCYASVVLDHLDPNGEYIHHRLFREHCHATPEGIYIKDLRIINRDLNEMVLVDNAAYSYAFQVDNGIPILPYYHGDSDFELKALQHYIERMIFSKDFREINRRTFKLHKYHDYYDDPEKLVEDLYMGQR